MTKPELYRAASGDRPGRRDARPRRPGPEASLVSTTLVWGTPTVPRSSRRLCGTPRCRRAGFFRVPRAAHPRRGHRREERRRSRGCRDDTRPRAHPCRVLIVARCRLEADDRLDAEVQVGGRLRVSERGRRDAYVWAVVAARGVCRAAAAGPGRTRRHLVASAAARAALPTTPLACSRLLTAGDRQCIGRRPGQGGCVAGPRTTRRATPTCPGPAPHPGGRCWSRRSTAAHTAADLGGGQSERGKRQRRSHLGLGAAGATGRARTRVTASDGPGVTAIEPAEGDERLRTTTRTGRSPPCRAPGGRTGSCPQQPRARRPARRGGCAASTPTSPNAEALAAVTGEQGLHERPAMRTHIWRDPVTGTTT